MTDSRDDDLPSPWHTRMQAVDAGLAGHTAGCPDCTSGRGCPDGDDAAEAEFRAFVDFRQAQPGDARTWRDDQIAGWTAT
jgi:hypothetical protein